MSKIIKDVEKMHGLLVECRSIFRDFSKDTIIDASRMERASNQIDSLIGTESKVGSVEINKGYWSK